MESDYIIKYIPHEVMSIIMKKLNMKERHNLFNTSKAMNKYMLSHESTGLLLRFTIKYVHKSYFDQIYWLCEVEYISKRFDRMKNIRNLKFNYTNFKLTNSVINFKYFPKTLEYIRFPNKFKGSICNLEHLTNLKVLILGNKFNGILPIEYIKNNKNIEEVYISRVLYDTLTEENGELPKSIKYMSEKQNIVEDNYADDFDYLDMMDHYSRYNDPYDYREDYMWGMY